MTGEPMVAAIVPAFRSEAWLAAAIDSVLAQTRVPDEVIVVDDGSPDGVGRVCARYAGRIVYARRPNAGPGAARNFGIRLSSARYLAFLDADDSWDPTKVERQLAFMEARPELVASCTGLRRVDEAGAGQDEADRPAGPGDAEHTLDLQTLLAGNPISTLTVMVRREALEEAGLFDEDPDLVAVEDYDLWLRLAAHGPIGRLDECLASYRVHGASLSGARRFAAGVEKVLAKAEARLRPDAGRAEAIRRHRIDLARNLAWELGEHGTRREAIPASLRALSLSPFSWASWRLLAKALLAPSRARAGA
ncbi:MAG: glycosyltransferase [Planctomycetota bacterium]